VLDRLEYYLAGEARTEGHIILSAEQDSDGKTVVYAIASCAYYGFENGLFTEISGCGAIPAVIKLFNSSGGYSLLSYTEPEDGQRNSESIKILFPERLWPEVLNTDQAYADLQMQKEKQAQAYLDGIGRNAKICQGYVDKEFFHVSADASNTLIAIAELIDYPWWIGSKESIDDGQRHIYMASEEDSPEYSVITFTKKNEAGDILEQFKYKIAGNNVELMQ
jgi:bla regulator protein blaR1